MVFPANISKNLRLLFTAITLLFVVGLNNREVTTYTKSEATSGHQINKSAADTHGTLKQKVSLEATTSYIVLQLAFFTDFIYYHFTPPVNTFDSSYNLISTVTGFFSLLLATVIQPNAP
ncbi:hypothetical protein [Adhaeribacter aquaticus]|uniref:hypothetical protein n=1 Tax=Adhaeribacter aquaticus TaxID=299567 RepID=UPI0005578798|nr:hypothetical protein [Adhaeribacter aquaticus]